MVTKWENYDYLGGKRNTTKLTWLKCKKVELFERETEIKKMKVELLHWLETNLNTQRKQKRLNFF